MGRQQCGRPKQQDFSLFERPAVPEAVDGWSESADDGRPAIVASLETGSTILEARGCAQQAGVRRTSRSIIGGSMKLTHHLTALKSAPEHIKINMST